jgi:deoxyribodipyrimidine photo-lyase
MASAEYAADELARDTAVAAALGECGLEWRSFHQFTALAPGTVQTKAGAAFRVFGAFRREWLAQARRMTPCGMDAVRVSAPVEPPPLPDWRPPEAGVDSRLWPAGEQAALCRLGEFATSRLDRYHLNRDFPARDGTSRLSPYLSTGTLSVRRCFEAALAANNGEWDSGSAGVVTWIGELIWREFYVHVLQAFPAVARYRALRPETEHIRWRAPGDDFASWQRGSTGFPLVDAGMRELAATGWMHNRARMMTATFLSKHLLIDWRHGERHFMHELLDGELAANNGGWQWCASCGTDAAPYFRVMSPARQAERFDPDGEYIRRYLPELARCSTRALHTPGHPELLAAGYPAPVVDATQARARALAAYRDAAAAAPAGVPECA